MSRYRIFRFVLHFEHAAFVVSRDPQHFVLEGLLSNYSCVKIALIGNRVFFKTLSSSVYATFIIRGSGQGVLKCKNY